MLKPLDHFHRDFTLFRSTTRGPRDFIGPEHLMIRVMIRADERLDFAKLVVSSGPPLPPTAPGPSNSGILVSLQWAFLTLPPHSVEPPVAAWLKSGLALEPLACRKGLFRQAVKVGVDISAVHPPGGVSTCPTRQASLCAGQPTLDNHSTRTLATTCDGSTVSLLRPLGSLRRPPAGLSTPTSTAC